MAKILIVEDDDHQRLLYREAFEEDGFEVIAARDADEALACIRRERLAAVILDVNMPGMNGLEALARIHDLDRKLPVVINSAYATYKSQYISWIADAYVVKSSNFDELKRAVLSVLDHARGES
jgi:DNA-binding response OmpR family regulator